jgi:hypothetical protein
VCNKFLGLGIDRLTFPSLEYKQLFLDQLFHLRGERVIIAQELDMPTLMVKVLYAPNEISNQTIAATLAKYGKIVKVEREMYRDWPNRNWCKTGNNERIN